MSETKSRRCPHLTPFLYLETGQQHRRAKHDYALVHEVEHQGGKIKVLYSHHSRYVPPVKWIPEIEGRQVVEMLKRGPLSEWINIWGVLEGEKARANEYPFLLSFF